MAQAYNPDCPSLMILPSFRQDRRGGKSVKPRIQVLEIRHRDRPDGEPIAWLLVEREETYVRDPEDNSVSEASIRISYQRIAAKHSRFGSSGKGEFQGGYSKRFNAVSLTSSSTSSEGVVCLGLAGLEGQRIGTYLMNEIVEWAKQWPEYSVNSIQHVAKHVYGFYEQFGLEFDHADTDRQEGQSRPVQAGQLKTVDTWKQNISEHTILDHLADVLHAKEFASYELEARNRACDSLKEELLRAREHPFWWVIKNVYSTYIGPVLLALLVTVVWLQIKK